MKKQAQLTDHQTETWLAVLSIFPIEVVNEAILKLGLSADPFPDLGKIVINCQQAMSAKNYAPGGNPDWVKRSTLQQAAKALHIPIE
jgi:hypothetical protein